MEYTSVAHWFQRIWFSTDEGPDSMAVLLHYYSYWSLSCFFYPDIPNYCIQIDSRKLHSENLHLHGVPLPPKRWEEGGLYGPIPYNPSRPSPWLEDLGLDFNLLYFSHVLYYTITSRYCWGNKYSTSPSHYFTSSVIAIWRIIIIIIIIIITIIIKCH